MIKRVLPGSGGRVGAVKATAMPAPRPRADRLGLKADFQVADIEALPYPHASFDTVTAACVICSVDDPVRGLREAARVVRPRNPAEVVTRNQICGLQLVLCLRLGVLQVPLEPCPDLFFLAPAHPTDDRCQELEDALRLEVP